MEDEYTSRLHSVALSESDESYVSKKISDDKAIIKTNNENDCLLCKCLDWCSWLSNIDCKKSSCCEQNIVCFMCCCSITFQ
jgi:hypothetical protein